MQYFMLSVFSLPTSLPTIFRIFLPHLIIIVESEIWISHCLKVMSLNNGMRSIWDDICVWRRSHQQQRNQPVVDLPTSLEYCVLNGCNTICMLRNMIFFNDHSLQSQKRQHGGCWRPGVYLVPGHLQPSKWQKLLDVSQSGGVSQSDNVLLWYYKTKSSRTKIAIIFYGIYFSHVNECWLCAFG